MIAASAAASTMPTTPGGSTAWVTVTYASSGTSSPGTMTAALAPMSAPARPQARQYSPQAMPPYRATRGERAVNTRCQMSWPMSSPKK